LTFFSPNNFGFPHGMTVTQ